MDPGALAVAFKPKLNGIYSNQNSYTATTACSASWK